MLHTETVTRIATHRRRVELESAIQDRWRYRSWYRQTARSMFADGWRDLAAENDAQILRLVKQLRRERSK